jgi:hypothetical protein
MGHFSVNPFANNLDKLDTKAMCSIHCYSVAFVRCMCCDSHERRHQILMPFFP